MCRHARARARARAALKHAASPGAVTLAFDRVSFANPLRAFDVLRLESEVVSVGRSSMLVLCRGFQQDMHTGKRVQVMKSYVTYVAMGEDFRPMIVRCSVLWWLLNVSIVVRLCCL